MLKRFTVLQWSRPGSPGYRNIEPFAVVIGLMWSIGVTLFAGVMMALWISFTAQAQYHLSWMLGICMILGALLGGTMAGWYVRSQGWLHGGLVGFFYGVLMLVFILTGLSTLPGVFILTRLPLLFLAGVLGGVVGINLPHGRMSPVRSYNVQTHRIKRFDRGR